MLCKKRARRAVRIVYEFENTGGASALTEKEITHAATQRDDSITTRSVMAVVLVVVTVTNFLGSWRSRLASIIATCGNLRPYFPIHRSVDGGTWILQGCEARQRARL